jgi:ribosomal protein L15E
VVGKSYEDLDHDTGYKLFYSSVQGTTITAVRENAGTKALLKSQETSKTVRVLRAAGCKWPGAPRVGIRYDGLYRVVSSTFVERGEKEIYMQFELVRLDSEDPIDRSKPTLQQEMLYMEVFKGY